MLLVPASRPRRRRARANRGEKNGHHFYNIPSTSQPPFFHYKHMHVYTREHQSVLTKGSMAMIFLSF